MKKYENFSKALHNLRLVREITEPYDVLTLTGGVALFQICFEQAWKAMKELLLFQGYAEAQTGSPRQILKLAYSAGIIQQEQGWLRMLAARNDVAYSYNEEAALALIRDIQTEYLPLLEALSENAGWRDGCFTG